MQSPFIFYGHFTVSLIVYCLVIPLLLIALYKRTSITPYLKISEKFYTIILGGFIVASFFGLYNFVSLRSNPLFIVDKKGLTYANTTIAWNEIKQVYCLYDYYHDSSWFSRRSILKNKDYLIVVPSSDALHLIERFPLNYRLGKVVEEIKGEIALTLGFTTGVKYLAPDQLQKLCKAIEETSGLTINALCA